MRTLNRMRRLWCEYHAGQTIVLFALIALMLMGALGLALDAGYDFAQRRQMQNAADAAALAGAGVIATNTNSGNYPVLSTVQTVAQQNGVDPSNVTCWQINDSLTQLQSCTNGGIAQGATGVQVSVGETHATFVMKALGVGTSSTAATAAARVEIMTTFTTGPFTVCGIDTTTVDSAGNANGTYGIFQTNGLFTIPRPGNWSGCGGGGNLPCKRTMESTDGGGAVPNPPDSTSVPQENSSIYYYDAAGKNNGGFLGNANTSAPTFLIHGPNGGGGIATCNITSSGFKGINQTVTTVQMPNTGNTYPPMSYGTSLGYQLSLTPGNVASVSASVNGPQGCRAGQPINNCVLLLPVIDNSGPGGSSPSNGTVYVAAREFMYFYVQQIQSGNAHSGRLIKNFHPQGKGKPGFSPGTTTPLVIHLIK